MSNDISDVNKSFKPAKLGKVTTPAEMCMPSDNKKQSCSNTDSNSMANSMDYLGAMGCAQVNMNNPLTKGVKASVDSFNNDPCYVQEHTELCDELVKRGYPLEKAIETTDRIFDTLKTEDTYK